MRRGRCSATPERPSRCFSGSPGWRWRGARPTTRPSREADPMTTLVIHGGAGALPRADMVPERAEEFHGALRKALESGQRVLAAGGGSLDAVEAAVVWLEDCPL